MTPIEALGRLEASTDVFVRAEDIVPVFEINGKHPKTETLIRQAKHPDGNRFRLSLSFWGHTFISIGFRSWNISTAKRKAAKGLNL